MESTIKSTPLLSFQYYDKQNHKHPVTFTQEQTLLRQFSKLFCLRATKIKILWLSVAFNLTVLAHMVKHLVVEKFLTDSWSDSSD